MGKEPEQYNQLSAVQRLIILSTFTTTGIVPEKVSPPAIGRTFTEAELGNSFHDIRPKHTIGLKTPREGKR